ncbi:MAG: hypothetical protein EAZ42_02040 [Verrucomicrobia bacterium]|nr:MAG: hypothetical protein EAZ42_02040 [Verrucomicrobiota bacterium]
MGESCINGIYVDKEPVGVPFAPSSVSFISQSDAVEYHLSLLFMLSTGDQIIGSKRINLH